MSTTKAERFILSRLAGSGTVFLAIHLDLGGERPAWADGRDAEERAVIVVNKHRLGTSAEAERAIGAMLDALAQGHVPDGVVSVAYAPKASAAFAEIVAGTSDQILIDGPRASGKTMVCPGALAALAEMHVRAGYPLPLRVSWLHDSLLNASVKTGASLEEPMWGGLWTLRDDRRRAVLTVAGVEMVVADFVGTFDMASQERLRASCHVVVAEEVVPSLDESGGVEVRKLDLARSSLLRLPARRRVAIAVTNPGDVDTWPYKRFIEGVGQRGTVRCEIPGSDRLTTEEIEQQARMFSGSPDLERRLARGEWSALKLGELVAEGFDAAVHVAAHPLLPSPAHILAIGWDAGHAPSATVAQIISGQVRVYAAMNGLGIGTLQLVEQQLIPWLIQDAPWTRPRSAGGNMLVHVIDPSMSIANFAQSSLHESSERILLETLGGRVLRGPTAWAPRREAVLRVLAPRHEGGRLPLQISPGPDTALLVRTLGSRWIYKSTPDGRVDRGGPLKPNPPFSDVGDSFAYLCSWLVGDDGGGPITPKPITVESSFDLDPSGDRALW